MKFFWSKINFILNTMFEQDVEQFFQFKYLGSIIKNTGSRAASVIGYCKWLLQHL
jgi:hypothetical protein